MRPEPQEQQTAANSRIKITAAEGVLKILEIYAKATLLKRAAFWHEVKVVLVYHLLLLL